MVDRTLPLPALSPIGGTLVLREVEKRLRVAERPASCLKDLRNPTRTVHPLADIIGFRLPAIAAGCEDGNDADTPPAISEPQRRFRRRSADGLRRYAGTVPGMDRFQFRQP